MLSSPSVANTCRGEGNKATATRINQDTRQRVEMLVIGGTRRPGRSMMDEKGWGKGVGDCREPKHGDSPEKK